MLCPKCNSEIKVGARFCSACGAALPASQGVHDLTKALREIQASAVELERQLNLQITERERDDEKSRKREAKKQPPQGELLPDQWYTPEELSLRIGQRVKTLQNWRASGKGPMYVKIGRKVFYPKKCVEAFLKDSSMSKMWQPPGGPKAP
jgi:hypothetical protein